MAHSLDSSVISSVGFARTAGGWKPTKLQLAAYGLAPARILTLAHQHPLHWVQIDTPTIPALVVYCEDASPYIGQALPVVFGWGFLSTDVQDVLNNLCNKHKHYPELGIAQGPDSARAAWQQRLIGGQEGIDFGIMLPDHSQAGTGKGNSPRKGNFRAWLALSGLTLGEVVTYAEFATRLGYKQGGAQAAGNITRTNPVSWLLPCHRVVHGSAPMPKYRWGGQTKRDLLAWEKAATDVRDLANAP